MAKTREEVIDDLWELYDESLEHLKNHGVVTATTNSMIANPAYSLLKQTVLVLSKMGELKDTSSDPKPKKTLNLTGVKKQLELTEFSEIEYRENEG